MVSDKLIRLFLFKYLTATIKAFFQGPRTRVTRPRDSRVVTSYSRQTSNLLWLIGIEITSNPAYISLHHYWYETYETHKTETRLRFNETGQRKRFSFTETVLKPVCVCPCLDCIIVGFKIHSNPNPGSVLRLL
jgi:hypothetical protein